MRKHAELSDPKSCLNTAEDDEPLFVLKGRDRHAPALVALWAVLRELDGEPPAVTGEARECVMAMMEWGVERDRKYVGFGQCALVAVMELIRAANHVIKETHPKNAETTAEFLRLIMSRTTFEGTQEPTAGTAQAESGRTG